MGNGHGDDVLLKDSVPESLLGNDRSGVCDSLEEILKLLLSLSSSLFLNVLDGIRGVLNGVEDLLSLSSGNLVGPLDLTRHLDEAIGKVIRGIHSAVERIVGIIKGSVLDIPNMHIESWVP